MVGRAVILMMVVLSAVFTVTVLAEESEYEWEDVEGGVKITEYTGNEEGLVIPSQLNGKDVVELGMGSFREKELTKVTIPGTVRLIGEHAFYNTRLVSVEIKDGVEEIKEGAFGNNNIEKIKIPDTVRKIGDTAFNSETIREVHLGKKVEELGVSVFGITTGKVKLTVEEGNEYFTVEEGALYTADKKKLVNGLKEFKGEILNGVEIIGDGALQNGELQEVTIPGTVKHIEASAFSGNQLKELELPAGLKDIGSGAFYGNDIKKIRIPGGVKTVGDWSFSSNLLNSLEIEEGVQKIGWSTFKGNKLQRLVLPKTIEEIGEDAFRDNLMSGVVIPENVTKLGEAAFRQNGDYGIMFVVMLSEGVGLQDLSRDPFNTRGYTLYGKVGTEIEGYAESNTRIEFKDITMLGDMSWIEEEGELEISIPKGVNFGEIKLSAEDQIIEKEFEGDVVVQDFRGVYDGWELGVYASSFVEVNSGEEIPEILIGLYGVEGWDVPEGLQEVELDYWEENHWKEGIPLNFWDEINVIGVAEEGEGMGENILRFEEDGGFMVFIPGGVGKEGRYEATIYWNLYSTPSMDEDEDDDRWGSPPT